MSSQSISPLLSDLLYSIKEFIIYNKEIYRISLISNLKKFNEAGYNINDKIRYKLLDKEEWCNPLQIALFYILSSNYNNYDIIKILLNNDSDINILDIENNSILHGCILTLDLNLLEYLLNNTNIDINIKNEDNRNAFELCEYIQKHYLELNDYKYILDKGKMTEKEFKDILKQMRDILYQKTIEKDLNYWGIKLSNSVFNYVVNN